MFWSTPRRTFREQLLDAGVGWLDGVLYTHDHADHTHGIDDLRVVAYNGHRRVEAYSDARHRQHAPSALRLLLRNTVRQRISRRSCSGAKYRPARRCKLAGRAVRSRRLPFRQIHGSGETLGFRFGGIAYSPDVSDLPEESLNSPARISMCGSSMRSATRRIRAISRVEQALAWIARVKPKRAVLTHMHVDLDYATLARGAAAGRRARPMTAWCFPSRIDGDGKSRLNDLAVLMKDGIASSTKCLGDTCAAVRKVAWSSPG